MAVPPVKYEAARGKVPWMRRRLSEEDGDETALDDRRGTHHSAVPSRQSTRRISAAVRHQVSSLAGGGWISLH